MKHILLAILLGVLILLPSGCKETTPENTEKLGQEFQLAIGQTANFSDARP